MALTQFLPPRIVALPLALCALGATAQAPERAVSPAAAFRESRALYYTPEDKGLQGFQCAVAFDWKSFIERATNSPVEDSSPQLAYLRSIKLTVTDDLNGTGELHWQQPARATDDDTSISQIRGGMEQMWSGFFQTWNGLYSADILTMVDTTTIVDRTPNGYHVFSREGNKTAEESFGADFTMHSLHVSTPEMDTTLTPTFANTPQGRLIASWNSVNKQPPTAPGTSVATTVHYAPVDGFQIPSEVRMNIANLANFDFHLSGCTVNLKPASPR